MRYSVKAAARATGVSRTCLRTWERRYGIPNPDRSDNGRRQYDDDDIAIIRRMVELVSAGHPASEAADVIRAELEGRDELPPAAEDGADDRDAEDPGDTSHPLLDDLLPAACGFDEVDVIAGIRAAVACIGWGPALEEVVFPLLRQVGRDWCSGSRLVATEHFAREIIRGEILCAVNDLGNGYVDDTGTVLACPEGEQHDVGLLGLSLLLRQRGVRVVYLGTDVPTPDLLALIEEFEPRAVCLSATTGMGRASLSRAAHRIVGHRPLPRLFVGGPALRRTTDDEVIPGARLPDSLVDATETIAAHLVDD